MPAHASGASSRPPRRPASGPNGSRPRHAPRRRQHGVDQGVGHDLALGAWVTRRTGRVGHAGQGGIGRNALLDRQQRGHPGHRVGSGTQGDVAVGLGLASSGDVGLRVEPVGLLLAGRRQLAVAHPLQPGGISAHRGVDGQAVVTGQAGSLARDQGGLPLGDPPGPPGRPGVRQLGSGDLGQAEVSLAAVVRLATSQRHLGCDPATLLRRPHALRLLLGALRPVQLDREGRLGCRGDAHQLLQATNGVDAARVVQRARRHDGV